MASKLTKDDLIEWHGDVSDQYASLGLSVINTITSLLDAEKIAYVSVSKRTKTLQSCLGKLGRKSYKSFEDFTDLLGIRIIVYLESDLQLVEAVITSAFKIDEAKSVYKSNELADNKIGYLSNHFICELGPERINLPELSSYSGMKFEVQIRTILQHAWAEIEHDRSYKGLGDIPKTLRRRLNLLAGTLELVDREFATLAKEIDAFSEANEGNNGSQTEEITSQAVEAVAELLPALKVQFTYDRHPLEPIKGELERFGLENMNDLMSLLTTDFISAANKYEPNTNAIGFVRSAMMFSNLEKYFKESWRSSWQGISDKAVRLLLEKYDQEFVEAVLEDNDVTLTPPDLDWD